MKKILSLVLALVMVLGCMSITAFAYENVRGDESTINSLTLAVGDVISVTKDLVDEEDKVTNLKFYNLDTTWTAGATEKVFNGNVPESYCISKQYPSCPSTGVLLVTKAWDETDKTIELAFYASEEDIPAAPSGKSGDTDITLTVAKELTYDMVIPEAVSIDAAGVHSVGQAKVENVKNATEKTVISYTAATTAFKSEGKTDIPASYYTDLQGTNTFPTTAVEVYKAKADAASIPTMYVGISESAWDAAENGTYTATVTYNFSAEEVEKVTIADILPEEFPESSSDSWWRGAVACALYATGGNLCAKGDYTVSVPVTTVLAPASGDYDYTCTVDGITWKFAMSGDEFCKVNISGAQGDLWEVNGDYSEVD